MKTKIIEVIYTQEHRGVGTEKDPHRLVTQLWSKEGNLIAESDPCRKTSPDIINTSNIELYD